MKKKERERGRKEGKEEGREKKDRKREKEREGKKRIGAASRRASLRKAGKGAYSRKALRLPQNVLCAVFPMHGGYSGCPPSAA